MDYIATLRKPSNSFVLGWKDSKFSFNEKTPSLVVPEDVKEYLETYLDIDNRPLFIFSKNDNKVIKAFSTAESSIAVEEKAEAMENLTPVEDIETPAEEVKPKRMVKRSIE